MQWPAIVVTWLIRKWHDSFVCDMTHLCVCGRSLHFKTRTMSCHVRMARRLCVLTEHMNESCHIWMGHITYKWVMSRTNGSYTMCIDISVPMSVNATTCHTHTRTPTNIHIFIDITSSMSLNSMACHTHTGTHTCIRENTPAHTCTHMRTHTDTDTHARGGDKGTSRQFCCHEWRVCELGDRGSTDNIEKHRRQREKEKEKEKERERKRECVCVRWCVWERKRERVFVQCYVTPLIPSSHVWNTHFPPYFPHTLSNILISPPSTHTHTRTHTLEVSSGCQHHWEGILPPPPPPPPTNSTTPEKS